MSNSKSSPDGPRSSPRPSLANSAFSSLAMRAIDIPSRYGFHLLIAGKLGIREAGSFFIVFGVLTLIAGLGRLGVDKAMTREVAAALANGNKSQARHIILHGLRLILCFSLLAAMVTGLAAQPLAIFVFSDPALAYPFLLVAGVLVPLCISAGTAGVLAGLHRIGLSQMLYSWLWPTLFCLVALWFDLTLESSLLLLLAATSITALIGLILVWNSLQQADISQPKAGLSASEPVRLIKLGWALFTQEIVQLTMAAAPALILGILSTAEAVGIYAIAWRLALILNLLVVALAAMAAPRFADCHARSDWEELRLVAAQTLGIVLALGTIPFAILMFAGPNLLSLFGDGFSAGTMTLQLLLAGQLVIMLTAATPELLGMCGKEQALRRFSQWILFLYLPLLALLSLLLAEIGAALATLAVSLVTAIGTSILCYRLLGFVPLITLVKWLKREVVKNNR